MNSPPSQMVDCQVVGGDRLPADSGGADAFCAAFQRAAAARMPGRRFEVDVRVKGPSLMTARLTLADGTQLPEQEFGISDRGLTKKSLERFATNLVDIVAQAASKPADGP